MLRVLQCAALVLLPGCDFVEGKSTDKSEIRISIGGVTSSDDFCISSRELEVARTSPNPKIMWSAVAHYQFCDYSITDQKFYLNKLALKGDPGAFFEIGKILEAETYSGNPEALALMEKAASMGFAPAAEELKIRRPPTP